MYHKTYPFKRYNSVVAGIFPQVGHSSAPFNFRAFLSSPQRHPLLTGISFLSATPASAPGNQRATSVCLDLPVLDFHIPGVKGFVVIRGFFYSVECLQVSSTLLWWRDVGFLSNTFPHLLRWLQIKVFLLIILLILRMTVIYFQMWNLPHVLRLSPLDMLLNFGYQDNADLEWVTEWVGMYSLLSYIWKFVKDCY